MSHSQQYCTFYLGDSYYGLDVLRVQEIVRHHTLTRVPMAPTMVRGLINLRGQIVTAIDLRRRLGLPDRAETLDSENLESVNIVLQTEEGAVSLLVDEIGDVLEVNEEQFAAPPATLQGAQRDLILGAYKLPQQLLVILDPDKIVAVPLAAKSSPAASSHS
jgi:purine-binding chemotaxis protein CheW